MKEREIIAKEWRDENGILHRREVGRELVRCKECKHGTYCEEAEMYICNANDQDLYEAEHFCSYGVKKGADDE